MKIMYLFTRPEISNVERKWSMVLHKSSWHIEKATTPTFNFSLSNLSFNSFRSHNCVRRRNAVWSDKWKQNAYKSYSALIYF